MVSVLVLLGGLLIPMLVGIPGQGQFSGTGSTTATASMDGGDDLGGGAGEPGDPCDPETYDGPYQCVPDPNSDGSGYIIAD